MARDDDSTATSPLDRSDPAFVFAAGLLEGSGDLADGLGAEIAAERLRELLTPAALWVSQPLAPEDLARPGSERLGRVPRWRSPGTELGDETVRAVLAAWASVCPPPPPTWGHPVLRVQVSCFEDARRLQALDRIGDFLLVPTLDGPDAFRFRWRWPLRVGIALGPKNAEWSNQLAHSQYKRLFDARPAVSGDPEPFDLLLVDPESQAVPTDAGCVIVVGDTHSAEELLEQGHSQFAAGILAAVPTRDVGWFDFVLAEMAHDQPLDVALRVVIPPSLIAGNATMLSWTAVRQWALEVEEDLRRREAKVAHLVSVNFSKPPDGGGGGGAYTPTDDLHRLARNEPFHAESHGASRISNVIRRLDAAGVDTSLDRTLAAAAARPEKHPPPDDRRVQALVRCATAPGAEKAVTDRFVPGAEHDVQVCIAAKRIAGAVRAGVIFESPTPGQDVELDVSVIVGGKRSKRSLTLPAHGDSDWTAPVSFTAPPDVSDFAVYVEVAYQKRVIQSLTLQGTPIEFSVDVNEPTGTVTERAAADGTITIVDGPSGEPAVIDLDVDVGDVGEKQIEQATKGLRRELLVAFLSPPASLADASQVLTRLAVRGRILYDRLSGGAGGYHENDEWIHVNAFSKGDVPIELAYTHPMPANDTDVQVCPEALAGAVRCDKDCPSRNRADVVCPYGFWATSKVIERRRHVPGRSSRTGGRDRQVSPMSSSVVGISVEADKADATSSARIKAAIASNVTSPTVADSWQTLDTVATGYPRLVVLVTHTIEPEDGDELSTELELNGDVRAIHRINDASVNPGRQEPGPVVLALGCDTNTITAGFTDLVVNLHNARAEIVLSALSPIPGKGVADFLERFMPLLKAHLQRSGTHRFGAVMLAARRETMAKGDLMALALSATGDADVELTI